MCHCNAASEGIIVCQSTTEPCRYSGRLMSGNSKLCDRQKAAQVCFAVSNRGYASLPLQSVIEGLLRPLKTGEQWIKVYCAKQDEPEAVSDPDAAI